MLNHNKHSCGEKTRNRRLKTYLAVKYSFDFLFSLFLLLLLFLPLLLIALLIKLDSPGPAFFTQIRVGQHGKEFKVYKFRTMKMSAPHDMPTSQFNDADKYITRLGSFLRKTSLDELPQLLNILMGDMSFVGFRPVCTTEKKLNALRMEYGVFDCRPGLTGLAQVQGRDDLYYKDKAKVDAEYAQKRSIGLDLHCLFRTVPVALTQRGAK